MFATIGYEGATLEDVIARLGEAGIETLVDVRAVAASRRAGFSKTVLSESLREAGIAYLHLRGLGTPKPGREAARKGRVAEMRAIYEAHLETPEARDAWAALLAAVTESRVALLCYEADAAGCHRRVLADRLSTQAGLACVDL